MLSMPARHKLYEILENDEGYRQFPYHDKVGKLTVGIGRNLDANGITREEAIFLLVNDVKNCSTELLQNYPFVTDFDDVRKIVLLSMWFNLGAEKISKFKNMWDALSKQDFVGAAKEMRDSAWFKQVGMRAERLTHWMETGVI